MRGNSNNKDVNKEDAKDKKGKYKCSNKESEISTDPGIRVIREGSYASAITLRFILRAVLGIQANVM